MWHSLQERQDGPRRWRAVVSFGAYVTAWFSGYSLAWGAKWLLAAAILGVQTAAPDILNQIWMRTYGGSAPGASPGIFTSTIYQFKEVGLPLFAVCWGVAGALIVSGAISGRVKRGELVDFAVLQLPLVIPVIWVMILRDHSIVHANFVSRSFVLYAALPLLSVLAVLSDSTARRPHGRTCNQLSRPDGDLDGRIDHARGCVGQPACR
jgi:hypothetical protein